MYEETFNENDSELCTERFLRFERDDIERLMGKRINGRGKIVGWTNATGELHPAYVRTDQNDLIAAHELEFQEWDGRHNFLDIKATA